MLHLPVTYYIISFVLSKFATLVLRGTNPKPFMGEVSRIRRDKESELENVVKLIHF
ncbi:hypothetical protein YC2023_077684 [Brassica napus]